MNEQPNQPPVDFVIKLDADRRREIDDVKGKVENLLREQLNVNNELRIVSEGQKNLKERFEMGVAKTLSTLDKKFDTFLIEWGRKLAEDASRDKAIKENTELSRAVEKDMRKYIVWPTISMCVSILFFILAWLTKGK